MIFNMQRKIYSPVNLREGKRAYDTKMEKKEKQITVVLRKVWKLLKKAFTTTPGIEPEDEVSIADPECVSAVVKLLEAGLTVTDIAMLALTPSSSNNSDAGADRDNRTLEYIANNRANPNVDQRKASEMEARIVLGEDRSKELLIPIEDPNVKNAAIRQQTIEIGSFLDGVPLPVVATDAHEIHRQVLAGALGPMVQALQTAPTPAMVKTVEIGVSHYIEHLNNDKMMPPEQAKEEMATMKEYWDIAGQAAELLAQQQAQMQQQGLQGGPDGMPVPVDGQPPQVGPDGAVVGEDKGMSDAEHANTLLNAHSTGQADRKLALEERKQEHTEKMDGIKTAQTNMQMVHQIAKESTDTGLKEAEADRKANA